MIWRAKNNTCPSPQQAAFDDAGPRDGVWGEVSTRGRLYCAATSTEFCGAYTAMRPAERMHFEMLREGRPLHLYADLDAYRVPANAAALADDGEAMLKLFCDAATAALRRDFDTGAIDVVKLDSSGGAKVSYHVVFRCERGWFADAKQAGAWMRTRILPPLASQLAVHHKNSHTGRVCFVDEGVYTRNRLMRLYGSHKPSAPDRVLHLPGDPPAVMRPEVLPRTLIGHQAPGELPPAEMQLFTFECPADRTGRRRAHSTAAHKVRVHAPRVADALPPPLEEALRRDAEAAGAVEIFALSYSKKSETVHIGVESRDCALAGRAHRTSRVYWHASLTRFFIEQRCYMVPCMGRGAFRRALPADTAALARELLAKNALGDPRL